MALPPEIQITIFNQALQSRSVGRGQPNFWIYPILCSLFKPNKGKIFEVFGPTNGSAFLLLKRSSRITATINILKANVRETQIGKELIRHNRNAYGYDCVRLGQCTYIRQILTCLEVRYHSTLFILNKWITLT